MAPREFHRADGATVIYSVTALSRGKRLISYFDITEMKRREGELAEVYERTSQPGKAKEWRAKLAALPPEAAPPPRPAPAR